MKSYMKLHCCSYWFGDTECADMGELTLLGGQPMTNLVWATLEEYDPAAFRSLCSKADGVLNYE